MIESDKKCPGCGISGSYLGGGDAGFCIAIYCPCCHLLLEIREMLDVITEKKKEPFWLIQDLFEEKEASMTD